MVKTRFLTDSEKCELVSALAYAKINNLRHAKECAGAAAVSDCGNIRDNLLAETGRYCDFATIDETVQKLISSDRLVIIDEVEED